MQTRGLAGALMLVAVSAAAQFQTPPHPATLTPPAQPPVRLSPPPAPPPEVNLKSGETRPARICEREVFYPCPDERSRNCIRKETAPCS